MQKGAAVSLNYSSSLTFRWIGAADTNLYLYSSGRGLNRFSDRAIGQPTPHFLKHCSTIRYPAALEMTLHYFQVDQLEPAQDKRLRNVFREQQASPERGRVCERFTPATVEQMASEHETVDGFISALEARVVLR